jgi:tRNA pseudouridine55 synthase
MDGLLVIDKPDGITSHQVVGRIRRILGTKRVGHTGTLDPFATGVMVLLVGKATRLAQFLDKDDKTYEATVRFGAETDTGDLTGTVTTASELNADEIERMLDEADWDAVLRPFRGDILQTPPMYSAKKVEGKKLYELARKGIEIERKAAVLRITELEIAPAERRDERLLTVTCSAGTYIRTLAEDIGRAVGTGAHLTALRRTRAGRFGIEEAVTLDALAEAELPQDRMLPIEQAVEHLPVFSLPDDRVEKTRNGMSTRIYSESDAAAGPIRMTAGDGELVAIGTYVQEENCIRPKIVLS